jgi:hypothetical protein
MSFKDKMCKPIVITGVFAASLITMGATVTSASATTPTPVPSVGQPIVPIPTPRQCAPAPTTFFTPSQGLPSDEASPDQGLPSAEPSVDQGLPSDEASPSHPVAHPSVTPTVNPLPTRCQPEQFRIFHADLGAGPGQPGNVSLLNLAIASGPVFGMGSDRQIADTRNVLSLPSIFRSVNVRHTGIGAATVTRNLPTCSITVTENGIWRFNGGRGLFRNAIGNGVFNLTGQWKFGNVRTPRGPVCSLALLRPGVNPLLVRGLHSISDSFSVVGVGVAAR